MDKNWWPENKALRFGYLILLIIIITSIVTWFFGTDWILDWGLASTASRDNFLVKELLIGPFTRAIEGQQYILKEVFTVGPLHIFPLGTMIWLGIIWAGLTGVLAIASFWKRYTFLVIAMLMVLFVNQLYLDELSLLGRGSWKWASILMMASLVGPAYYFHAFREKSGLALRWSSIFLLSVMVMVIFQMHQPNFYLHLAGYGIYGFGLLALFFIFLIAEEIVFMILYLITRSKGGTHNEKHLTIFVLVYILYLGVYWADKMSIIQGDWDILNPFYLLVISTLVAMLTISYKQQFLAAFSTRDMDIRWLLIVLALIIYGLIGLGSSRGNDAIWDGLQYVVLYAHIGFGIMFFLYIIFNFVNPLIQGLMIYKIAYKEQNFPYVSARLAGLVFFIAFYFYGEQIPLRRLQGAKLNFEGDYHQTVNPRLAREYYEEAAVFAWDNNYASWKLAMSARDPKETIYRLNRATTRNPTPYTYVALAEALHQSGETTRAIATLRAGQIKFPKDGELLNNLAYYLHETGAQAEALEVLNQSRGTESWNQAVEVNRIAYGDTSALAESDRSLAIVSNYLAIKNDRREIANLTFDPSAIDSTMDLHKVTYLVNSGWSLKRDIPDSTFRKIDQQITNAELSKNLKHANAYGLFQTGKVNRSIRLWGELIESVHSYEKGFFYNQLGDIYLSLHAPRQAYEAYEEGIYYGSNDAVIGKAIALLEMKEWVLAKQAWQEAVTVDDSYSSILEELDNLEYASSDPSFAWMYYQLPDSQELYGQSIQSFSNIQINMLWSKLFDEMILRDKEASLEALHPVFAPYLNRQNEEEFQQYRTAKSNPSTLQVSEAADNAYDAWKVLLLARNETIPMEDRYNLLVDAIEINEYHPRLIEAYAFASVDMGLYQYGEETLLRLLDLVSPEDYNRIERALYDYRQEREQAFDSWTN